MTNESNITSFSSTSPNIRRVSSILRIGGNIGFWIELIVGVPAFVLLLLSIAVLGDGNAVDTNAAAGSAIAFFCATAGIILLAISIFFFFRYRAIGRTIVESTGDRPSKAYTLRLIKFGLIANLTGMFISIVGAESFTGILFDKASNIPPGAAVYNTAQLIKPAEIMVLLANIHTIFCHFVGIAVALVLLDRLNKQ